MKKTGEILRKKREEKGLSLHEIALSLKINSKTLKAIEDGDTSQLPAKTFLRGFVQSYAHFLKINPDEVLAVFAEEMGTTKPGAPSAAPTLESEQNNRATERMAETAAPPRYARSAETSQTPALSGGIEQTSKTKAIIFSIVSVVLLSMIFFTKRVIDRYQKESTTAPVSVASPLEPTPETSDVPKNNALAPESAPTTVVEAPQEKPAGPESSIPVAESDSATRAEPEKPAALAPAQSSPPVALAPPGAGFPTFLDINKPASSSMSQKPTEKIPETAAAKPTEPAPPPVEPAKPTEAAASPPADSAPQEQAVAQEKPSPPPKKSLELIVEALDSVEIEFSGINGRSEKLKLNPEQVHRIRSHGGLKLSVSNGGAVNLILNGRDLGVPGDLGKPIKLTY